MSRTGEHILAFTGVLFVWIKNMSTNCFANIHISCWTGMDILNNCCFRCFRKIAKTDHEFRHIRLSVQLHGKIRLSLDNHHHHVSVMDLGHFLTRSGLTYPEVASQVCHDSFCQSGRSVSLSWVIYYEAFYLHVVSSFSCIPVICPNLVLFLQFVYLFCHECGSLSPRHGAFSGCGWRNGLQYGG